MKGEVIATNPHKGYIAVRTDGGTSVIELLGAYSVEIDDIISGNLERIGGETLRNETQLESMDVFIQGVHCTAQITNKLMW